MKVFESKMLSDQDVEDHYNPSIRLIDVERSVSANCGFQLTRGKWDPYPWINSVEPGTAADLAGLKPGDCLLEVNGEDVIGQRISEVAEIVKSKPDQVSLLLWNAGVDPHCTPEAVCCGPMPTNLQRLSACMSTILAFLECPVCLDTIPPPTYQCENGHLICIKCRTKSERCPVCRVRFTRGRSLLSDQVYNALIDAFNLKEESSDTRSLKMQQIFRLKNKNKNIPDIRITHSRTNKILEQGSGKANSFDNLMHHAKFISTKCSLGPNNEFHVDNNLKTKSLSTHDISHTESPIVSRSASTVRLHRNENNNATSSSIKIERPASYHGSYENLQNKINDLSTKEDRNSFQCPFTSKCDLQIEGGIIFEHFKNQHDAPLIQFFKPHVKINLDKVLKHKDLCYVVQFDENTFFLRFELIEDTPEAVLGNKENVLLWAWFLGDKKVSKEFEMQVTVTNEELNNVIMGVRNSVYSLSSVSYREIKDLRKGVFLNVNSLKCATKTKDILLDVTILKSDCD